MGCEVNGLLDAWEPAKSSGDAESCDGACTATFVERLRSEPLSIPTEAVGRALRSLDAKSVRDAVSANDPKIPLENASLQCLVLMALREQFDQGLARCFSVSAKQWIC